MARSRQERKQDQQTGRRRATLRANRWGLRRLRKFWNNHLRRKKEVVPADEQTLARFEVQKQIELATAKSRLSAILKAKSLQVRSEFTDLEFKRYKRYLRKCSRRITVINQGKKGSDKLSFHQAEVKRVKEILYGSLTSVIGV